jgi:hypothetical protein
LGCGFQRSFCSSQGDFEGAFKMYPAILPRFSRNFGFNWIDSTEITKIELVIGSALLNGVIMIVGIILNTTIPNFFTNVFI